jgi:hypothetical protein
MVPIDASKVPMAAATPLPAENLSAGRGPNNAGMPAGELPRTLRHAGFDLRQVKRIGQVALYKKTKGNCTGWEIILIRKRPGHHLPNGKYLSVRECYPASSEWGIRGWTAMSFATAQKQFNKQVQRHAKSK